MTWDAAENQIADNTADAVAKTALGFNRDIKRAWPVDTGFSRRAWSLDKVSDYEYEVSNDVSYSPILWVGRRFYDGKWHGSVQLPLGGEPIYTRSQRYLEAMLQKVTK